MNTPTPRPEVFRLDGVTKRYPLPRSTVFGPRPETVAVADVSLSVTAGESLAIVGESGSGKSTLLRLMLGLTEPSAGTVWFKGRPLPECERELRRSTGVVFQDPYATFNPRRTIGQSVREPLEANRIAGDHASRVAQMLRRMELPPDAAARYPRDFSGGQRQRAAIARALIHDPEVLIGDEPVSALDVLVRSRILDLLATLQSELGLTLVTVTHDLAVVPRIASRVAVMRSGALVETGTVADIFTAPKHPYTQELIEAIPKLP